MKRTTLPVCRLGDLAKVGLGFKSLQNQFFYVAADAIEKYGIEKQHLRPIFKMKQLTESKYVQTGKGAVSVFYCRDDEQDLHGTGALKYIRGMENRPAAEKKQAKEKQTIKKALEAQGGGHWYAPKAQLNKSHIWLRKAVSSTHSPFIFRNATALDQRCNFVRPLENTDWRVLGAVLTSSFFTLSAECSGASSLGAGALELATKRLPTFKVLDIRALNDGEKEELVELVERVWEFEQPLDWTEDLPKKNLHALDQWFAARLPTAVEPNALYTAIAETCKTRLALAQDKKVREKQHVRVDIRTVASGIAEHVRPIVEAKLFPEAFVDFSGESEHFDLTNHERLAVDCHPMMADALLTVRDTSNGKVLVEKQYPRAVAQVIVKALMLGRRKFSVPLIEEAAGQALENLSEWLPRVMAGIDEGFRMSALGTKYEAQVYREVLAQLAIHDRAPDPEIFGNVAIGD